MDNLFPWVIKGDRQTFFIFLTPKGEKSMFKGSEIFEKNYDQYCEQIANLDFSTIIKILGIEQNSSQILIPLLNKTYQVYGKGIADASGTRPDYSICVILAKYLLLCPA